MSVDTPRCRRPRPVTALVTVLCILGLTGLGGGVEMLVSPRGGTYLPPERLDDIPLVDTYIVPGLVLAIVFGVGSLVAAVGMVRRRPFGMLTLVERRTGRHWSWALATFLGGAFALWLTVEVILLGGPAAADPGPERTTAFVTYVVFGSIAVALLVLPRLASVRRYLRAPRH